MIRKWLHNKKYKGNPMCPCTWRMIPTTKKHFDYYWKCKWDECTWEAFSNSGRIKFWKS